MQRGLVVAKEQEVVAIAHIGRALELALDEVVERVEVEVGPRLRGEVADGQPARAQRRQQVIAGIPLRHVDGGEHAGAAGQDVVDERQHRVVGDGAGELGAQDGVVMRNA